MLFAFLSTSPNLRYNPKQLRGMNSIPTPLSECRLFKPSKVGTVEPKQRIAFLPLTRYRSDDDYTPLSFMQKYCSDRGSAPGTLVISKATSIAHVEERQHNIPSFVSGARAES